MFFSTDHGSVFIQPDGPAGTLYWLSCHDMDDVDEPRGDVEQLYCPNVRGPGEWDVALETQGPPGMPSTGLSFPLGPTADYLEQVARVPCTFPIYVIWKKCGDRDYVMGFERGSVVADCRITNISTNGPQSNRDGGNPGEVVKTFELTGRQVENFYEVLLERLSHGSDQVAEDIVFAMDRQCPGECGARVGICTSGLTTHQADAAATAQVYFTSNAGVTWAAGAADPFAADEHISAAAYFLMSGGTRRALVARGVTDAANPAEVAYSDDGGATWTTVNVGSTNGEFVPDVSGMVDVFQNGKLLFLVTDTGAGADGNIYKSEDYGLSWTQVYAGAGDALNAVDFSGGNVGLAVGDTNTIFRTLDGGDVWGTVAGPAAMAANDAISCAIVGETQFYVGYDSGNLYYTRDAGTTWEELTLVTPVAGATISEIHDIKAIDRYCVWVAIEYDDGGDTFGALQRTICGGTDNMWETHNTPILVTDSGLKAVHACDYNSAFGAGGVATTTMVVAVAE
jgi:hypothetical protein